MKKHRYVAIFAMVLATVFGSAQMRDAKGDDQTLERQVHEQLATRPEFSHVNVHVKNGVAFLEGSVPRKEDRKEAAHLAKSVPGVREVEEKLSINASAAASANAGTAAGTEGTAGQASGSNVSSPSGAGSSAIGSATGTGTPSAEITAETGNLTAQIQNTLRKEPTLANDTINVNVTDSTVELSGSVATGKQKQTAHRIAQSYAGNRRVVDHITVGKSPSGIGTSNPNTPPNSDRSNNPR